MGSGKSPVGSSGGGNALPGNEKKEKAETGGPVVEEAQRCCGCRFPLLVALLQLLLGIAIAGVAFLMVALSPSLLARETPYWAGIIMCVVSLVGFILFCINRVPDERASAQFITKLLYFLLCMMGLVISMLVIAYQCHHCALTYSLTCDKKGEDCICTLDPKDPIARTFNYSGVTDCRAIKSTLPMYNILQMVLNLAQAIVCLVGAFMIWKHRYQVFFAGLQTGSPSALQWQNV
ncbi:sarcospan-like isoform X1 [Myxocyprinus asiaticus]|uniref:sarcospan-like isoform X1 n=1 Tax=Myxocyprinus asiaticus TaxID=70543 RepID=UPI002223136E|nr:sarcospan-like isoform X1 [Myxocyprinus asiaticus]